MTGTPTSTLATGVRIAYLPASWIDDGSGNCFAGGGRHDGDGEFIVVDVGCAADTGKWYFLRALLSAHCGVTLPIATFVSFNASCQWWNADMWQPANGGATVNGVLDGAPIIWVSRGEHAFYPSATRRDSGQAGPEICDDGAQETYGRFRSRSSSTSEVADSDHCRAMERPRIRDTNRCFDGTSGPQAGSWSPDSTESFASVILGCVAAEPLAIVDRGACADERAQAVTEKQPQQPSHVAPRTLRNLGGVTRRAGARCVVASQHLDIAWWRMACSRSRRDR